MKCASNKQPDHCEHPLVITVPIKLRGESIFVQTCSMNKGRTIRKLMGDRRSTKKMFTQGKIKGKKFLHAN